MFSNCSCPCILKSKYHTRIAGLAESIFKNQSKKNWKIIWLPCWNIKKILWQNVEIRKHYVCFVNVLWLCTHFLHPQPPTFPLLFNAYHAHSHLRRDLHSDKATKVASSMFFLLAGINSHTHKHFCLSSSLSFLACSLLATWLLIMHSFLLF